MAGEYQEYFARAYAKNRLIYINEIMKSDLHLPVQVINAATFVRQVEIEGASPKIIDLSDDDLKSFALNAQAITVAEAFANKSTSFCAIPNTKLVVDRERAITGFLVDLVRLSLNAQDEKSKEFLEQLRSAEDIVTFNQILRDNSDYFNNIELMTNLISDIARISVWKMILHVSILSQAEADLQLKLNEQSQQKKLSIFEADYITDERDAIDQLKKEAISFYLRPTIKAILNKQVENQNAIFRAAGDVFRACASQLRFHQVLEKYHPAIYDLVDATAKSLAGEEVDYVAKINALPLRYNWTNILIGAGAVFLGLTVCALVIAFAVSSSGATALPSYPILELGAKLMLWGAGFLALSLVGMGVTMFALTDNKTEVIKAAENFHAHQTARLGG